jgi:XTP/dITP diphosphohydrolase
VLRLVTASANPHKVAEIEAILGEVIDVELLARPADVGEVVEDADTLLGNARLKAQALRDATGIASVADDTGLFVDALDGAPGVHSARFAGPHASDDENCERLLVELARCGALTVSARRASFRTVALVAFGDGSELWREGTISGVIAPQRQGVGGFGYDPLFVPHRFDAVDVEAGRSFAELGVDEKNRISHRARAFTALADALRERG